MARLGDVYVHALKEDYEDVLKMTEYPVERGEPFTDHIEREVFEFSIDVSIVGPDSGARLQKLRQYQAKGQMVKFVGRATVADVVIKRIGRVYTSEIGNGVDATITLRKIRIAKSPWAPHTKPVTQTGKQKPVNKQDRSDTARYHVVIKGDTYWALARKYGSTVQQLRDWNSFPDRRIPIGSKLRVK